MYYALFLLAIAVGAGFESRDMSPVEKALEWDDRFPADNINSSNEDDAELIRAMIGQQQKAWNAGDLEKFMQPYWNSPKLTFSSGGQTTRGWQATLDRYKKKYSSRDLMGQLEFSDLEIDVLSEQTALVLGKWRLKREKDQPHGNFTLVLRRFNERWKIIHDHSSSLEEQQP